jgi:parallel beta-helix repeat protein
MRHWPKTLIGIFFIILFSDIALAYQTNPPIILDNIHATPEAPYIIEGYEITNPEGDCIKITNSKNIIIRNNYLHDCGTDKEFQERTDHYQEGYATLIGNSKNIVFENNRLEKNFRGFMAYNSPHLTAKRNNITNTLQYSPLWFERCDNVQISYNYLADNGNPMHFWNPGVRSIGIWVKRANNLDIHHNTVLRSTSDGIAVTGHIYTPSFTSAMTYEHSQGADWSGLTENANIYNNLLLDNMEQGVWLVNARNIKVYNNTIRTGCFTPGSPISTEFNVGNSEFYSNKILGCLVSGVGGDYSFNNYVHDNLFYTTHKDIGTVHFSNGNLVNSNELERRKQADYQLSEGNIISNNSIILIGGILAEEIEFKKRYAEIEKTYEAKGWMSCETQQGILDEECVERESAKGEQGVLKEMLFFSSLMENFNEFAISEVSANTLKKAPVKEEKGADIEHQEGRIKPFLSEENCNEPLYGARNSWKDVVIGALVILLLVSGWYNLKNRAINHRST